MWTRSKVSTSDGFPGTQKGERIMRKLKLILLLALLSSAAFAAEKSLMLFDFEDDKEIKELFKETGSDKDNGFVLEKSTEYVTSGKNSLKAVFPEKGDCPGVHFLKFKTDWSGYDVLKADVYNPSSGPVSLNFAGADKDAGFTTEKYFGEFKLRCHASTVLRPGKNTFELDLNGITTEDGSRVVNLKEMKRFALFVQSGAAGLMLYFDNIRLEKSGD